MLLRLFFLFFSHYIIIVILHQTSCYMFCSVISDTVNANAWPWSFQRWLLEKSACTPATARLHTAKRRLMFGLWSGKGLSPGSCSSILLGRTLTSDWRFPRSYRSIVEYSCFYVGWVLRFPHISAELLKLCQHKELCERWSPKCQVSLVAPKAEFREWSGRWSDDFVQRAAFMSHDPSFTGISQIASLNKVQTLFLHLNEAKNAVGCDSRQLAGRTTRLGDVTQHVNRQQNAGGRVATSRATSWKETLWILVTSRCEDCEWKHCLHLLHELITKTPSLPCQHSLESFYDGSLSCKTKEMKQVFVILE